MATAHALYTYYSDNVARDATITIQTGTDPADDDYAPTSLVDDNPAKVAKIDSTTGAWQFDFGFPQRLDLVALIHHTFEEGCDVTIEADAAPNWATPDFSAAITIPAWVGSGDSLWPVNPWLDLTEEAGYSASGWQYWRLVITGNDQNIQLGEIVLSASIRQMDPDRQWEYSSGALRRRIDNRTEFGVSTVYSRYSPQWRLEGTHRVDDAFRELLTQHWHDVDGAANPWLYVPDGDENRCYLVRFTEPARATTHVIYEVNDYRFAVEEVARGLRPGV